MKKATAKKPQVRESSGDVFADLGSDREESEHLRMRSGLMITLGGCFDNGH